jgi:hypothetical protein
MTIQQSSTKDKFPQHLCMLYVLVEGPMDEIKAHHIISDYQLIRRGIKLKRCTDILKQGVKE